MQRASVSHGHLCLEFWVRKFIAVNVQPLMLLMKGTLLRHGNVRLVLCLLLCNETQKHHDLAAPALINIISPS